MDENQPPKWDPTRDNEALFDAEVLPLLRQALTICRDNGMPFLALVGYSGEGCAAQGACPAGYAGHIRQITDMIDGIPALEDPAILMEN